LKVKNCFFEALVADDTKDNEVMETNTKRISLSGSLSNVKQTVQGSWLCTRYVT